MKGDGKGGLGVEGIHGCSGYTLLHSCKAFSKGVFSKVALQSFLCFELWEILEEWGREGIKCACV